MDSDELNRSIQFLIDHQAYFAVRFERNQEVVTETVKRLDENLRTLTEISRLQSNRLDRHDQFLHETRTWQKVFEEEAERRHAEVLQRLDGILERIGKPSI